MIAVTRMRRSLGIKIFSTVGIAISSVGVFYLSKPKSKLYATSSDNSWIKNIFSMKNGEIDDKTLEVIRSVLTKQEYTKTLQGNSPVLWFETNHYNANQPIEDRHCECYLSPSNSYFFGIFDGHSGWHCSESLRTRLPIYMSLAFMNPSDRKSIVQSNMIPDNLAEYLGNPYDDCLKFELPNGYHDKQKRLKTGEMNFAQNVEQYAKDSNVGDILKYTYLSLDRDICKEAIPDGQCNETIWSGLSGAVAIGVYIKGNDFYVANAGDCRGVLGVRSSNGSWYHIPLSDDHTANNESEIARLTKEHPQETSVIKHQRLLGQLQPLRSFGDVIYKWPVQLHKEVINVVFGHSVVPQNIYLTPPYLTAQPDVLHKKINEDDKFIIIATDGLWDTVSNEMAVQIVADYLKEIKQNKSIKENGATRLIKYALSQGNQSKLFDMLRLPKNLKRNYHDDITVTVIYFNEDYKNFTSKL